MMKAIFLIFLIGASLLACSLDESNKVGGDNFYVHFDDPKDLALAEKIAKFWKEKKLLTGKQQDLKLVKQGSIYELFLMRNDEKDTGKLSAVELNAMILLQKDLNEYLKNEKKVQIVIADSSFKKLFNINE